MNFWLNVDTLAQPSVSSVRSSENNDSLEKSSSNTSNFESLKSESYSHSSLGGKITVLISITEPWQLYSTLYQHKFGGLLPLKELVIY